MTPFEKLELRHQQSNDKLKELADKKFKGKSAISICYQIASNLGVSGQTVYNYYTNKGRKDGYLKESIIEELKKL